MTNYNKPFHISLNVLYLFGVDKFYKKKKKSKEIFSLFKYGMVYIDTHCIQQHIERYWMLISKEALFLTPKEITRIIFVTCESTYNRHQVHRQYQNHYYVLYTHTHFSHKRRISSKIYIPFVKYYGVCCHHIKKIKQKKKNDFNFVAYPKYFIQINTIYVKINKSLFFFFDFWKISAKDLRV